ncbi:MAG: oligosaccharide flippase family protein [Candidatus Pacebacteria bacterium]|nr:oligosaccharide flippase family protein [Candidatus Paceibacterota bacterium]
MIPKARNKLYRLLRWSEKYTKTDMLYLAKGGFWVTFGQTITSILSLGLIVAFANLLPKDVYGLYRYILALAGVLNIFTLTGMNSAVARAVAAGHDGALRVSVKYQLKWNLLMLTAFFTFSGYYFINDNTLLAISFLILGIFVPSTLALNTYGAYLEGKRKFQFASISNIISTLVYVGGILAAILLSGEIVWLIAAYAITTFATTLFFYIVILRKFKPSLEGDVGDVLKYGRKLSFIRLIGPITGQIDKIILTHFWGPAQLAVYWLALAVPDRATSFMKNWVGLGFPKFATKTPEEINTVFYKRIFQGMFIGTLIAVTYILISPYLFKYLLPQYIEGVVYSQILALGFIFAMPNRYVSLLFESQKLSRLIFIRSIIQSVILVTLYVILGIWGGVLGLVIANVSNSLIALLIGIGMWRRNTNT